MAINIKYSRNGYDPLSEDCIDKKNEIILKRKNKQISQKQYGNAITELKSGWKFKSLLSETYDDFNNSEIIGTMFMQREPFTDIFPPGMTGVTFRNCNLDNCNIPPGNTVIGGTNKQHVVQNDGESWEVDAYLKPLRPLSEKAFDALGLSKNPNSIPTKMAECPCTEAKEKEIKDESTRQSIIEMANDPEKLEAYIKKRREL